MRQNTADQRKNREGKERRCEVCKVIKEATNPERKKHGPLKIKEKR